MTKKEVAKTEEKKTSKGWVKGCLIAFVVFFVLIALLLAGISFAGITFFKKLSISDSAKNLIGETIKKSINADQDAQEEKTPDVVDLGDRESFQAGANQEWPKEIPAEVPEFTYGTLEGIYKVTPDDDSDGWILVFTGVESSSLEKYKIDLLSAGWLVEAESLSSIANSLIAQKDNIGTVVLGHSPQQEEASLTIEIGK